MATADWGYLGLRKAEYDDKALSVWAKGIAAQSWTECFTFFKHEDTCTGPRYAARLLELLGRKNRRHRMR